MTSGNLLEKEVENKAKEILAENDEFCSCQQCYEDVVALALSNLKPRYAGSKEGKIVIDSVDLSSTQTQMDVLRAVVQAAELVNDRPHHDRH